MKQKQKLKNPAVSAYLPKEPEMVIFQANNAEVYKQLDEGR